MSFRQNLCGMNLYPKDINSNNINSNTMKDMKNEQIDEIKKILVEVLKKNRVKRAALFGSIVRGEATEESDIDLLIEFEGRKSLLDLVGLKLELQELLRRKVDVLTYGSLHPLLKERILSEQEVIL